MTFRKVDVHDAESVANAIRDLGDSQEEVLIDRAELKAILLAQLNRMRADESGQLTEPQISALMDLVDKWKQAGDPKSRDRARELLGLLSSLARNPIPVTEPTTYCGVPPAAYLPTENVVCDGCRRESPALPVSAAKDWAEVTVIRRSVDGAAVRHHFDLCRACQARSVTDLVSCAELGPARGR